ncbi:MAG TPA: DHA2 family efflux MFS transporter permease subunit [Candidatus Angelobacter sp.]|nr:DHA2 family efflux MFS transporter permease subunit [Candidatus Angelobacter sp.]
MAALAPAPRPTTAVGPGLPPDSVAPRRTPAERRRWLALVSLCIGQLMIVLDATIVNVALPSIQTSLHFSPASLAWVVNGYFIAFGGLLLLMGRLGDLVGRRRVFLSGLAAFSAASLLCGLAPTGELLVLARFAQGMAAAAVSAMVLAILVTLFPTPRQTARAMSVYACVASAGGAIGLLLGGVLTAALSWHWIFFVNLPIGVAALVLGFALIPVHVGSGLRHGVDVLGAVLVTAAPSLAIYTILQASENGWTTMRTLLLGVGAVVLGASFVAVETRVRTPLMPLRVFRSRQVTGANLVRALFPVGLFGSLYLGALYLQNVLGYDSLHTGLAFLPQSLAIGTFSMFVTGRLVARFSAKATLIPGLLLVAAGLALFARMPVGASYVVDILPVTLLIGIGAGLVFMPSVALAMAGARPEDTGVASGLANVSLQIGAALGVAVLAGVSTGHVRSLLADGVPARVALASGYHLALVVAVGCLLAATAIGALVLRGAPRAAAVALGRAEVSLGAD